MGDEGFNVVGLGGELHFEILHTTTGASMPGIVLDKKGENTVSVLMDPGVSKKEKFLLGLVGGTMASMRHRPAEIASILGPSSLNPLQSRMVMTATGDGADPARPGDLSKVQIGALMTGCVLKNAFRNDTSTSLEVQTKRVARDVYCIFGKTSKVMNGPCAGGMIVSSVV